MTRLIFVLILLLIAALIYEITGRNRRQLSKIPEGMSLLCQPPKMRYIVYALGVFTVIFIGIVSMLYIVAGAPEEARQAWGVCVALAVLISALTVFIGNIMAKQCVYFNSEKIQAEAAFQKSRIIKWSEIRKIDGNFDSVVNLYLADGTKFLTVSIGMINYEVFCEVLKKKSPEAVQKYYQSKTYEHVQKRLLRYGTEYYIVAICGIILLLGYLAAAIFMDGDSLLQLFLDSEPSEWFSLLFAPVCGVAGLIFLFIMSNTKVNYTEEKIILKYPLRAKSELYWPNIRKIEVVPVVKYGVRTWKNLQISTDQATYRINFELMKYGKDDFITEIQKMIQKYEIPCTASGK